MHRPSGGRCARRPTRSSARPSGVPSATSYRSLRIGRNAEPWGPPEPPSSSAWHDVQAITCETVIVGERDDGRLGTFGLRPGAMTGWNDGLLGSNESRVFVPGTTRSTRLTSPELSPWHLKQISYAYLAARIVTPFRSTPETFARRPETFGG